MLRQNAISPNQEKIKVLLSKSKERLLNNCNRRKVKYHEDLRLFLLSVPFRYKLKERESSRQRFEGQKLNIYFVQLLIADQWRNFFSPKQNNGHKKSSTIHIYAAVYRLRGRRVGLMLSLPSGSRGPGAGHCVFLTKTFSRAYIRTVTSELGGGGGTIDQHLIQIKIRRCT